MRRRFGPSILVMLAVLAFAGGASAGGSAEVTVQALPADPEAGGATTIELEVLQHGQTPVSWPNLTVVATDDTGAVVRVPATPQGPVGRYAATIVFPEEGTWRLSFESTDLLMDGAAVVDVLPAVPPQAPAQPASSAELPALILLAALGIGAAIAATIARRGRRPGATEVPASARG